MVGIPIQSVQLRPGGASSLICSVCSWYGGLIITRRKPASADQRPVNFSKFRGNLLFYKRFPKWLSFCACCSIHKLPVPYPSRGEGFAPPARTNWVGGGAQVLHDRDGPRNQVLWLVCGRVMDLSSAGIEKYRREKASWRQAFFSALGCFESRGNILA